MTALESPIVGLTFRVRELGRLRMGQKVPTRNGKTRPEKLETFRLTSTDWRLIGHAAQLYGGKPETWADAPGWNHDKQTGKRQFQVVVEADAIPVKVPDDLNWSQAMEAWTAAKCIRRCNGDAMDTGEPCKCREEMEEGRPAVCKPYSRVNLILPELPGWGFWRLETHGWEAAREFIPMVVMAARFGPDETYRLRIDPRTKKGEDEHGKPVTYQFGVPVLDTDRTPAELFARNAEQLAIEASEMTRGGSAPPPAPGPTSEGGERDSRPADRHDPPSDTNASAADLGGNDASQAGREPSASEAPTYRRGQAVESEHGTGSGPGTARKGNARGEEGAGRRGNPAVKPASANREASSPQGRETGTVGAQASAAERVSATDVGASMPTGAGGADIAFAPGSPLNTSHMSPPSPASPGDGGDHLFGAGEAPTGEGGTEPAPGSKGRRR